MKKNKYNYNYCHVVVNEKWYKYKIKEKMSMENKRKRYSVKDISILRKSYDETLLFCQFLDDFYITKSDTEKYELIKDEPIFDESSKEFMSMLACAVHKLSNDYGLKKPTWIYERKYILDEECYAFHTKNKEYQDFLKSTTPYEYKSRNLLYGEDVLKRC